MNNTFSIHRFGLLLKRQWLEFGKIYLISLAVVLGVLITFYSVTLWSVLNEQSPFRSQLLHFRVPLFLVFGFIFISVIASSYFAHLGQKSKAIIDLMIPASTFEKFMGGLIFASVLSISSFLILFYLTDLAFISKLQSMYKNDQASMEYFFRQGESDHFFPIYFMPFLITSIFMLGSIYFEKFHYIKTTIVVMIFVGIWTAIVAKLGEVLFEGRIPVANNQMRHMFSERETAEYLGALLIVVLTLIFWTITYVRLKEKEV